jgi:hypothetical protein
VDEEVRAAYDRGLRDGDIKSVNSSDKRAHTRLDKHDRRITALERVMYIGMGILLMAQVMPTIFDWVSA